VKLRVKICCISSEEECDLAVRYGASAIGLVSEMPSGPGVICEETIARIVRRVPPGVSSFLLTCKSKAREIIRQQRRCGTNTIQICDTVDTKVYAELRQSMPGVGLVQVIHVSGEESIRHAESVASYVDAVLLDSGNPALTVKELGGTGRVHNWKISARIVERISLPVFLAGGLNSSNVREAAILVRPFGVDVCSGVRTDSRLDESKLAAFFSALEVL
jgi:phosphoribosylanthranilate isomerase